MTYQVQRRDTLWARAERHLGDPLRYPEIIARNPTAVGPDNEIYPGTVLVLPSDATGLTPPGNSLESSAVPPLEEVTVEPGDTLWDLAEELTGDGGNWRQAWELNRGRTEPGRATFTDPSLIRPGWTLSIPNPVGNAEPEPEPSPRGRPQPSPHRQNRPHRPVTSRPRPCRLQSPQPRRRPEPLRRPPRRQPPHRTTARRTRRQGCRWPPTPAVPASRSRDR
jgi:LysM repeat protein